MGIFDWFRRKPVQRRDEDLNEDVATPPLADELDLHTFQPRDVQELVEEYLHAARDAGFPFVRVIHGKGKGTLRRIVHSICERHPAVASFKLADQRSGSWGATLVELKRRDQ